MLVLYCRQGITGLYKVNDGNVGATKKMDEYLDLFVGRIIERWVTMVSLTWPMD